MDECGWITWDSNTTSAATTTTTTAFDSGRSVLVASELLWLCFSVSLCNCHVRSCSLKLQKHSNTISPSPMTGWNGRSLSQSRWFFGMQWNDPLVRARTIPTITSTTASATTTTTAATTTTICANYRVGIRIGVCRTFLRWSLFTFEGGPVTKREENDGQQHQQQQVTVVVRVWVIRIVSISSGPSLFLEY